MPTRKKKVIKKKIKKSQLASVSSTNRKNHRVKSNVSSSTEPLHCCKKCSLSHKNIINHDNGIVKRIPSPNRTFTNKLTLPTINTSKMCYQGVNRPTGLSPKEKSFLICSCQSRSKRYMKLKNLAANAIKHNKIFTVYGPCNAVRKALVERGWVEKITPDRMNLAKLRNGTLLSKTEIHGELEKLLLSNFVEKYIPNFIWRTKDEQNDTTIDMSRDCTTIVNKLKTDALWTTKQGLCTSMKSNYWFYIEDVAEVNSPRTFNSYDAGEVEGFEKDYKITACTSLLKWILSMVANERPVFVETGSISMKVVIFALNRCKEYLFTKQNKDIDRTLANVSTGQWNAFLKKYYLIIGKDEVFKADKENKLSLYTSYAKILLKEMHKYRPQVSCEGCHNIWILKPAHNSRGRGIRMASKLGVITNLLYKVNSKYVIQKYIEEPLLIHDTKFDIRQYYLVTSTYPLVIWMYKECYLKFSTQKYSLKNYHESIHLTNNAIQRKYVNCTGRHPDLPTNNMWDSIKYRDYLNRIGKNKVWDNIIYPGMRKSIVGIMLSCQDSLSVCKNRFELYGCDFILDKEYKPWLIEINSCPDLNHTTHVTAKICPSVISDIIKVVIDYCNNPTCTTGNFECIYHQPMTLPRYALAADLSIRGYALPLDYFYKGKIEITESFGDDVDIGKERNIAAILSKLKHQYDTEEIMVEPEEDFDFIKYAEHEASDTPSECELSLVATVITEQLDDLLDRIISEPSFCSKSKEATRKSESEIKLNPGRSSISEVNLKSILKRSCSGFMYSKEIGRQTFKFSALDDGPIGKGSFVNFESFKKTYNNFCTSSNLSGSSKTQNKDSVLEATAKMISFINKKQTEYLHGMNTGHF